MGRISDFLLDNDDACEILCGFLMLVVAIALFFSFKMNTLINENLELRNKILDLESQSKPYSFSPSSLDSIAIRGMYLYENNYGPR